MNVNVTLAEVGARPGTAKEIHKRLGVICTVEAISIELLQLYRMGKVTRRKMPQESGRPQFVYSVADEAASQA